MSTTLSRVSALAHFTIPLLTLTSSTNSVTCTVAVCCLSTMNALFPFPRTLCTRPRSSTSRSFSVSFSASTRVHARPVISFDCTISASPYRCASASGAACSAAIFASSAAARSAFDRAFSAAAAAFFSAFFDGPWSSPAGGGALALASASLIGGSRFGARDAALAFREAFGRGRARVCGTRGDRDRKADSRVDALSARDARDEGAERGRGTRDEGVSMSRCLERCREERWW